jgi:signal transduction histidine kinase
VAPAAAPSLAVLSTVAVRGLLDLTRARRRTAEAEARVAELEALALEVGEARRAEAESRRVVAHELKTPLTSVRGLAQLLSRYDLSEAERRRVAGLVADEAARLSTMVESLLDLERLKLQDFAERSSRVDLSLLAAERAAVHRGSLRAVTLEAEPGVAVKGDAALLSRLLDNLIGNALKFSPEGSPVSVSLRAGGGKAVLEVADRGPGVPEGEREAIFRRFARGSAATATAAPGLGLGLALVAEVAAWHGGCVEASSRQEGGAVFRVSLPLAGG